jgi:hypothetical protein
VIAQAKCSQVERTARETRGTEQRLQMRIQLPGAAGNIMKGRPLCFPRLKQLSHAGNWLELFEKRIGQ